MHHRTLETGSGEKMQISSYPCGLKSLDFELQNNPRAKYNDHRRVGVKSLIAHQDYHPNMLASPHVVPFLSCLGTSAVTVGILRGFRRFVKPFQYKMNSRFFAGTPEKEIAN